MRARLFVLRCLLLTAVSTGAITGYGQDGALGPASTVVAPASSLERPGDIGIRAHTNHLILQAPQPMGALPTGMAPSVIRSAYGLPAYAGEPSGAGAGAIAIVDAYDYPSALTDFNIFSDTFGLPQETGSGTVFDIVYDTSDGLPPSGYSSGWALEAALGVEWAHAMAPTARIVLVEAASNSFSDLLHAVSVAANIPGVREISMSWGGSEFHAEISLDSYFAAPGVVYLASSGDVGGRPVWPGASPNVVCVGGTTLRVDDAGNFLSETAWSGSGGGKSKYERRPIYQDVIREVVGRRRGLPDVSFNADPSTGASVYWQGSWLILGGTSVAAPSLAGVVNLAASSDGGDFAASSLDELANGIYADLSNSSPSPYPGALYAFRDIVTGSAGRFDCQPYWDFVTGVGTPWGLNGK